MIRQFYVVQCQACRGRCVGRRGVIDWGEKKNCHFEVENYTSRHFELQLLGECRSKGFAFGNVSETLRPQYKFGLRSLLFSFFLIKRRKEKISGPGTFC